MVYIVFVFLCILLVSLFLMRINVYLNILYTEQKQQIQLKLSYKKLPLVRWKWIKDQEENIAQADYIDIVLDKSRAFIDNNKKKRQMLKKMFSTFQVHDLYWKSHFGLGTAPETGIALGSLWSVKGIITSFLIQQQYKPNIDLFITPYFNQLKFSTHFKLEATIPIRTILLLVGKIVKIRRNKNG